MRANFKDKEPDKVEVQEIHTSKKDLKNHEGEWYDQALDMGEKLLHKILPNKKK